MQKQTVKTFTHLSIRFVNNKSDTARENAVKGDKGNAVKSSAGCVVRPYQDVIDQISNLNSASMTWKQFDYIDAQGRSKSVMAWVPIRN